MANNLVKISVRGFAEVASAESKRKQSTLRKFRFPESEESVGRSNYYVKALSGIKRHHRGDHAYVKKLLHELLLEAASEADNLKKARLLVNHRALVEYLRKFGSRVLVIKPGKQLYFVYKKFSSQRKARFDCRGKWLSTPHQTKFEQRGLEAVS